MDSLLPFDGLSDKLFGAAHKSRPPLHLLPRLEDDQTLFHEQHYLELGYAKGLLEHPGLTARLADLIGSPMEGVMRFLPGRVQARLGEITQQALLQGLQVAIGTLDTRSTRPACNWLHRSLVTVSGSVGGLAGLPSIAIELPISTGIILRSIADIARSEGHDLSRLDVRLSCLEVLALGGTGKNDDATENGYWALRTVLAKTVSDAGNYIAEHGLSRKAGTQVMKLVLTIAERYGVLVSEEVAAKAIPIVGAVSGGLINLLFMNHFQQMAHGHFIVKRLEAQYGTEVVREHYRLCSI